MQSTHVFDGKPTLGVSLELSNKSWKLAFNDGRHERPSTGSAAALRPKERFEQVLERIAAVKRKWCLPADCRVVVIYEAGQDGFWIERALRQQGIEVLVVDAASIPVSRQARRAKTDRLDALLLLDTLWDWLQGKRHQIRMVHAPSAEAEAQRQLPRDRGQLQKEVGQHRDRIRKLLRTIGCWDELTGDVGDRLTQGQLRTWDDQPVSQPLQERLLREWERLQLVQAQLNSLERGLMEQLPAPLQDKIRQLALLSGIGWVGAMRLVLELYWRNFHNRRQVGCCVGLVSQPYDSGDSRVDQGISKQGNRRVRSLLIELAWMWLRYQPDSAMAQWFAKRTAGNAANKRGKRIAIVAVARRLAIALWRYLTDGVVPQGAHLKQGRRSRSPGREVAQMQAA
jgi:transposase